MSLAQMSFDAAERELWFWQYRQAGGFVTAFFECAMRADQGNLKRLILAFPALGTVADYYKNKEGYWEDLCERMNRDRLKIIPQPTGEAHDNTAGESKDA